ncbi:uncharacterized protein IWZ02DRAFT_225294 [Phyllosticta citriasiana]|uniref:uncharacterized protein n=1 Tax=Phyllosticta citriasiana TaxID=595635 RepID=UPI0030FD7A60
MLLARRSTLSLFTLLVFALFLVYLHADRVLNINSLEPTVELKSNKPTRPSSAPENTQTATSQKPAHDALQQESRPQQPWVPSLEKDPFKPGVPKPGGNYSRILVVPRTHDEDVSWINAELPDLDTAIYTMDDWWATLKVPKNKGRESMAYLTYIIDHYDNLPDVVLFFHAHKVGWHNLLILGQDTAEMLKRLRSERVWTMGYFPARCDHKPGCPDWLHLDRPEVDFNEHLRMEEKYYTPEIWRQLHPPGLGGLGEIHRTPSVLSAPCCAQFGVSRDRIRANPKEMYEHYRDWLLNTDLEDQYAGRIMEYTWHYIFTRQYQYCPSPNTCYCEGYGICFGNQAVYEEYNKMEERRWEVWEILGKPALDMAVEMETRQELINLEAVMERMKNEAIERGKSEEARRLERERLPLY